MTDDPIAIPPRLAITAAPATLAVGAPWPIDLTIDGDVGASELVVMVRSPAQPVPGPDDARFIMTGSLVANGPPQWLAADGSWSATDVAHDAAPVAGPRTISLALPAATAGEWRAIVMLRDANGVLHALASAAVLVSDTPAIRVAIDRTWASEVDLVTAFAQVAVAGRQDLQLIAWLTLPDGNQLVLPEMSPTVRVVPRVVGDEAFPLIGRDFVAYGPGDYRVAARLVDADGNLLAAGGAGFTVCTTPGSLDGTIVDAAGAPVTFDAQTTLTAIGLERPRASVQVPIATDGSFHVELPVGTWAIAGRPFDGAGMRAIDPLVVDVGCAGPAAIQVVAGGPNGIGMRLQSPTPRPIATRGNPAPTVRALALFAALGAASQPEAENLGTIVVNQLQGALSSDVELTSHTDQADLARLVMLQQQLGSEEKAVEGLGMVTGDYDYLVVIWVLKGSSRWTITINFAAPDGTILSRRQASSSDLDDVSQFLNGQLPALATLVAGEAETKLRQRASVKPSEPVVTGAISPEAPVKGGPIRFSIHLKDFETCEPAPAGTMVTFDYELSATVRGHENVPVDALGTATLELTVPDSGNRAILRPSYSPEPLQNVKGLSAVAYYREVSNIEITLDKIKSAPFRLIKATLRAVLPPDVLPVAPPPTADAMPAAFTTFQVTATEGSVPTTVTTNADGVVGFDWLIGDGGVTIVAAGSIIGGDHAAVHVEPPHLLEVEAFPTTVALTDTPLEIRARVLLDNAVPGVGVPIVMSVVSGSGTGARNATDADGRAALPFRTPALPGETELRVTATYDGVVVFRTLRITARPPCAPNCPPVVVTTDDPDGAVAKGGTIRFFANQDVTWSATGGSITPGGVLTAFNDGGVWTVTAASNETPGAFGTRDYIVDCDDYDLIGTYPVQQTVTVFDADMSCADGAPPTGTFEIMQHGFPIDASTADAEYTISPTCGALFGVGELLYMPRIERCTLSQVVSFSGCPIAAFAASAVGPGVSGLTGSYTRRFYELATATCHDVDSIMFEPPPP